MQTCIFDREIDKTSKSAAGAWRTDRGATARETENGRRFSMENRNSHGCNFFSLIYLFLRAI